MKNKFIMEATEPRYIPSYILLLGAIWGVLINNLKLAVCMLIFLLFHFFILYLKDKIKKNDV